MATTKKERYSYTKLNTYDSCPFHFYLKYKLGKYLYADSCASLFGTLIHYILELEANCIKNKEEIDYEYLIDRFKHTKFDNTSNKNESPILAIDEIEKRFKDEWASKDTKSGLSYKDKSDNFINNGIYEFPKYIDQHPELEIIGPEVSFNYEFSGSIFTGFIDLLMYDKDNDEYIIWDIKTKDHPFEDDDLTTPLQFVCYCKALRKRYGDNINIKCFYSLPVINIRQSAGTKGFEKRGENKIKKILDKINNNEFTPKATPLCYWCEFSNTNPNITPEGKNQCPFYSLWTKEKKSFDTRMKWKSLEYYPIQVKRLEELDKLNSMSDDDFLNIEI